jgi:hypothetical protein
MGPIRSSETSARYQPALRNIPEDDKIQVNRSESLDIALLTMCLRVLYDLHNK